jgi:hypothetical protein
MWKQVQCGNFKVKFDTWQTYQNVNIGTTQDLTIAVKNNIFRGVHSVFINTNDTNNTNIVPYYQKFWFWPKLTTQSFQFRIAGEWLPELPIQCDNDSKQNYQFYQKWVNSWQFDGILQDAPNISEDDFEVDSFILMGSFENEPGTGLLNNVSTRKVSPDIQMRLKLLAPPPAGTAVMHFINGTSIVLVPPCKGQFTVIT